METLANQRSVEKAKLYLSHSCNNKTDPLPYESKIQWVEKMFGNKIDVVHSSAINMFYMLHELYIQGFRHVIYVCGEDRYEDTSKAILQANGQEYNKKGQSLLDTTFFEFDTITFENAGIRNESSLDIVERASASLARQYALQNDFQSFKNIVPLSEDDAILLFDEVQTGLGVTTNLLEEDSFKKEKDLWTSIATKFCKDSKLCKTENITMIEDFEGGFYYITVLDPVTNREDMYLYNIETGKVS